MPLAVYFPKKEIHCKNKNKKRKRVKIWKIQQAHTTRQKISTKSKK